MLRYLLKRVALLVPTFFFVSLVAFFVLNIAPGRPGASGEDPTSGARPCSKPADSAFREQFHLDKPILLNTRPWLARERVRSLIVSAYDVGGTAPTMGARIRARETLDDFGTAAVTHLVPLLDDPDPEVRRLAACTLHSAVPVPETDDPGFWKKDEPARETEVVGNWKAWWEKHDEEFVRTPLQSVRILFLDTRFAHYWSNLLRLDFGRSSQDQSLILPALLSKVKYSVSLALVSVLLAYTIAVPLGVMSAIRQGTPIDVATTVVLFLLFSLPTFFAGTVYLRLFTEGDPFSWFPTGGWESHDAVRRTTLDRIADVAWHLVLPVATYTAGTLAALSRYARTGVIDVIRADYVRTARAKGLAEPVVIVKHAARNGMIPILTLLASLLPVLVGGSVVIEVIFNIPGMGLYLFEGINFRDYNRVMAVLLASSALSLLGILLSDVAYALVDPRITFE
jgi:peptide/nickel transport system permease protein